jgi:hypothetical protein
MPDTPALQEAFGQSMEQWPGCGVPMAHLLGLFHAGTGLRLQLVRTVHYTHATAGFSNVVFLHEDVAPERYGMGGQPRDEGWVRKNGRILLANLFQSSKADISAWDLPGSLCSKRPYMG